MPRAQLDHRSIGPWLVASMLLATLVVGGCAATARLRGGAIPSPLRVGVAPDYPPLAYRHDGRIQGVEVDFAHKLAGDLGVEVVLVETTWDQLIPALREDRIDVIMSGMSITEQRQRLVRFTDPYLKVGQMALVRRSEYRRVREPGAMNAATVRVGYIEGTTGEQFVRAKLPQASPHGFDSADDGVAALRAGVIDVFIDDAPTIWRVAAGLESPERELRGLYTPLTEEYLAWAVRPQDERLRKRLNEALRRWKASGALDDVLDHWIRVRVETVPVKPAP